MEDNNRAYCNDCDTWQWTTAPRHSSHGLLDPLELPCHPWTAESNHIFTDTPSSAGYTNIFGIVNWFSKMAHFLPLPIKDSPSEAIVQRNKDCSYHGSLEDGLSNRNGMFTGQYVIHLYKYLGISWSISTALHQPTDGQNKIIHLVTVAYV
jgi:hypothetical protein